MGIAEAVAAPCALFIVTIAAAVVWMAVIKVQSNASEKRRTAEIAEKELNKAKL